MSSSALKNIWMKAGRKICITRWKIFEAALKINSRVTVTIENNYNLPAPLFLCFVNQVFQKLSKESPEKDHQLLFPQLAPDHSGHGSWRQPRHPCVHIQTSGFWTQSWASLILHVLAVHDEDHYKVDRTHEGFEPGLSRNLSLTDLDEPTRIRLISFLLRDNCLTCLAFVSWDRVRILWSLLHWICWTHTSLTRHWPSPYLPLLTSLYWLTADGHQTLHKKFWTVGKRISI